MLGKLVELIEPISLKHHMIGINTQVSNSTYALHKTINIVTMPMRGVLRPFRKMLFMVSIRSCTLLSLAITYSVVCLRQTFIDTNHSAKTETMHCVNKEA